MTFTYSSTCERCEIEFQVTRVNNQGVKRKKCDSCRGKDRTDYHSEHYSANKRKKKNIRLKRVYGITVEEFDQMLKDQDGVCAICRGDKWGGWHGLPSVDHDHSTGRIRGLLCYKCNTRVGWLENRKELILEYIK